MVLLWVLLAIIPTISASEVPGVYRLPINRTSTLIRFKWAGSESTEGNNLLSRTPLHIRPHLRNIHAPQIPFDNGDDDGDEFTMFWSIYTAPISLGNPPQNFTAIVDTSWSSLFVISSNCTLEPDEREHCSGRSLYNSSRSSTYEPDLTPYYLLYRAVESLDTEGLISRDSVHVGGMEIQGQDFGEGMIINEPYGRRKTEIWDTVMGLSLHPILERYNGNFTTPSLFHSMIEQKLLKKNLFTLKMPRTDAEEGELIFGDLPKGIRWQDMIELPLDTRKHDGNGRWSHYQNSGWQVQVKSMSMSFSYPNTSTNSISASSSEEIPIFPIPHLPTATISSSYPWILLPKDAATRANAAIGLSYFTQTLDCNLRPDLPDWTITFGYRDQKITLTPWDYLVEMWDKYDKKVVCASAFLGDNDKEDGEDYVILGAPFLNGVWSVWDADRGSVSFKNREL